MDHQPPPGPPPGYHQATPESTQAMASTGDQAPDNGHHPVQEYYSPQTMHGQGYPAEKQQTPQQHGIQSFSVHAPYNPADYAQPPLPPRPQASDSQHPQTYQAAPNRISNMSPLPDDPSSAVHYTRDPHQLVAYLVPFPKPQLKGITTEALPPRFLIYTPPPPPLQAPKEGEAETKAHKVQRKWQEEVRAAKNSDAKTMSWKGVKSKATRGISTAMGSVKSSNLEFLNRIPGTDSGDKREDDTTHRTIGLEQMTLVYPPTVGMSAETLRQEFVNSMLRSKSKAQKDAIIATGLLPVSGAIDLLATPIWPFGGLLEIDGVWAIASIQGAKTSRSVTKRLTSSSTSGKHDEDKLHLEFRPSHAIQILEQYLAARCHERDPKLFPSAGVPPTESDVLEAIGWSPSQTGGEQRNWEDEQWELTEVKEDVKGTMGKGAKEWGKWVKEYEKNPEKALKK